MPAIGYGEIGNANSLNKRVGLRFESFQDPNAPSGVMGIAFALNPLNGQTARSLGRLVWPAAQARRKQVSVRMMLSLDDRKNAINAAIVTLRSITPLQAKLRCTLIPGRTEACGGSV